MKKEEFFLMWREDFDDQMGWFIESQLVNEIERIKKLIADDEDGEATIYSIIKGEEVSKKFGVLP